jgi:hypothetical protein
MHLPGGPRPPPQDAGGPLVPTPRPPPPPPPFGGPPPGHGQAPGQGQGQFPPGQAPGVGPYGARPRGPPPARVTTVADPLDPAASNYGHYRTMSYVDHTRGPPGLDEPAPVLGPAPDPTPRPPPPLMPMPMPMPGPGLGPMPRPLPPPSSAEPPELGPVMGPARPADVPKELIAFMPASLRNKRATAAQPRPAAGGLMRPRSVAAKPPAPGPAKRPAPAPQPAPAPKQTGVNDAYDNFMDEMRSLGAM